MRRTTTAGMQSYSFWVGDAAPLTALVDAVAFAKDVDSVDLDPLARTIDPDALEALFESSDSVTVSFEIEDLQVTVRGTGEIEVTAPTSEETIHAELEGVSHVLLLEETDGDLCHEHLSAFPPGRTNVIGVQTSRSADDVLRRWASSPPANGAVLEVGGAVRSAASTTPAVRTPPFTVEPVSGLGSIGIRVSELLSDWAGDPNHPAVCVDSLEDLLDDGGLEEVFVFLQPLLSRVRTAGGIAHVHLDPTAVDDRTRHTLEPLFDAVVEVDAEGERTVRRV